MKKISKKLIAFFIVTTLLTSMIGSVAYAATTSYKYGGVGLNDTTTGYLQITSTGAYAATGCDASTAQVDVRLTYYYTNKNTGKTSNITSTNGYVGSTSTSLTIPSTSTYKSSSATSTHRVWYNSQFWNADSEVTYTN